MQQLSGKGFKKMRLAELHSHLPGLPRSLSLAPVKEQRAVVEEWWKSFPGATQRWAHLLTLMCLTSPRAGVALSEHRLLPELRFPEIDVPGA